MTTALGMLLLFLWDRRPAASGGVQMQKSDAPALLTVRAACGSLLFFWDGACSAVAAANGSARIVASSLMYAHTRARRVLSGNKFTFADAEADEKTLLTAVGVRAPRRGRWSRIAARPWATSKMQPCEHSRSHGPAAVRYEDLHLQLAMVFFCFMANF